MKEETTKLTVRLPTRDAEFAKAYARTHGLTVTEVIDRYLRRMRTREPQSLSAEVELITGLVPADVDAEAEYRSTTSGIEGARLEIGRSTPGQ